MTTGQADPLSTQYLTFVVGDEEEALAAGARGFIVKPFTSSRVLEALTDAVG